MKDHELKTILQSIIANDYAPPANPSPSELMPVMLRKIGVLDPELRDDLIFNVLSQWIYQGIYTREEKEGITRTLLDAEHLFLELGNPEHDALFTRAFSVLQLSAVLFTHREKPFLSNELLQETAEKILAFYEREVDYRGYVEHKGWGHSIAHCGDAMAQLAQLYEIKVETQTRMLHLIARKTIEPSMIYTADETERLAAPAALLLIRSQIPAEEVVFWLDSLKHTYHDLNSQPENLYRYVNARNLLRGVYFYLRHKAGAKVWVKTVDTTLQQMHLRKG